MAGKRAPFTVFDTKTGETQELAATAADTLIEKATFWSRVSRDILVKDKLGRVTHEIYDASVDDAGRVKHAK